MLQLLTQQDCFAHHALPLKRSLPRTQPQMAVEHVENGTWLDFEVDAQAISRFAAALVAQVIPLLVHDWKRADHGDTKRPLPGRPRDAERRRQSEIGGEGCGLIVRGPRTAAFELLQSGDVRPLRVEHVSDAS